jgi:N4-(beta-N-acetylglucosaminyl)-L-asparaginase
LFLCFLYFLSLGRFTLVVVRIILSARGATMGEFSRRKFFLTTLAGSVAAGARRVFGAEAPGANGNDNGAGPLHAGSAQAGAAAGTRPIIISSANGFQSLTLGMGLLKRGADTLDAVIATVNQVEDDPKDDSVGYGGLPNEEGIVELDASVMHGPSRRAGAVASLRDIKNPSKVARAVMEHTDHVLLAGAGALHFAEVQGFERMNLLTDASRVKYLAWKATASSNWGVGLASPDWKEKVNALIGPQYNDEERAALLARVEEVVLHPPTGTINCLAVNEKGDISGVTTTSGLAWKIAGRVGDSPIIGAGLYVDNDIGAAGSTGRGEENIKVSGAHTIVEMMRKGMHPKDACLEALGRVARNYNNDKKRLGTFHLLYYALNKDGAHGGASLWSQRRGGAPARYAVHDGTEAKRVDCAGLLEGMAGS